MGIPKSELTAFESFVLWLEQWFSNDFSSELNRLYLSVPATRCAANCSDCCRLSDIDLRNYFAVMYPLYKIEYFNIVMHLSKKLSGETQFNFIMDYEERPAICRFLDQDTHQCKIYDVRPYVCRTYGILKPAEIDYLVKQYQTVLPEKWLVDFIKQENNIVCDRIFVPQKSDDFMKNRILGNDILSLQMLQKRGQGHDREVQLSQNNKGKTLTSWTWGGFNALYVSPDPWFKSEFQHFWFRSMLKQSG